MPLHLKNIAKRTAQTALLLSVSVAFTELLVALLFILGILKPHPSFIPNYLSGNSAAKSFDENGSPILVNGQVSDRARRVYDEDGLLLSDQKDLKDAASYNVGFFGDSYLQALQVPEEKTFAALYEKHLRQKTTKALNIVNYGVGGTGTYHQLLRYKTVKEKHRLRHVILFFTTQNDVLNNHSILGKPFELENAPYVSETASPQPVSLPHNPSHKNRENFFAIIAKNLFTARIVFVSAKQIHGNIQKKFGIPTGALSPIFHPDRNSWLGVFSKPPTREWEDAWRITERVLLDFNKMAIKHNADLTIIFVADSIQIYHAEDRNAKFDVFYPNRRLSTFCQQNRLKCLDSLPYFLHYRRQNNLTFPYFSWKDDGHYSELGNKVMFEFLKDSLTLKM